MQSLAESTIRHAVRTQAKRAVKANTAGNPVASKVAVSLVSIALTQIMNRLLKA